MENKGANAMIISKVGKRGQITIPREVRRWLALREQDKVAFIRRGHEVILLPLSETLFDLRGSVVVDKPQNWEEVRKHVIAEHARKVAENEA